jgi:hypothetical protein
MSSSGIQRLLLSLLLTLAGVIMVLVADQYQVNQLFYNLGLASIVAGIVSTFREIAILRTEAKDAGKIIAEMTHNKFADFPLDANGMRIVSDVRRGYDGYYYWAVNKDPQNLFFAGRSVLHRIDFDFVNERGLGPAEVVLERRLIQGSDIRILFIDPRSELIGRLAEEEGQTPVSLLSDVAVSIGICKRLYANIQGVQFPPKAALQVRIYNEIPYFAYHKEDSKVIVGFYFSPALGWKSPAFEVLDARTRDFFEAHFSLVFDRASDKTLLELSAVRGTLLFNDDLYESLYLTLADTLGSNKADQLIAGKKR